VLRQLAVDFVPETIAAADCINGWLDARDDLPTGTPLERSVGFATFETEAAKINAMAQPYRFYLLKRVHADFDAMEPAERFQVEKTLEQCNLLPVIEARLKRAIGRQDNLEVWL
jgi:hypothetical protein